MQNQQGISLMEVFISLIIMSIGLLAILKMQILALQAVDSGFVTSVAIVRLDSLRAMHAFNPNNFSELFTEWTAENTVWLPEVKTNYNQHNITLSWYDNFTKKFVQTNISY